MSQLCRELKEYVLNKKCNANSNTNIANIYLYNSDSYSMYINKSDLENIIVLSGFIVRDTIYLITKDKYSKLSFTFSYYREKNKDNNSVGKTILLHSDITFILKQLLKSYDDKIIIDKLMEYLKCDTY